MINPFAEVNWQPGPAEKRTFAVSLMIGFPCVAAAMFVGRGLFAGTWSTTSPLWLAGVGVAAGGLFWLLPMIAKPFYLVWFFVSCLIGIVISNTLMAGFYLLVLSPIGLLLRTVGRSGVRKTYDRRALTYWVPVEKVTDPTRYYNQF